MGMWGKVAMDGCEMKWGLASKPTGKLVMGYRDRGRGLVLAGAIALLASLALVSAGNQAAAEEAPSSRPTKTAAGPVQLAQTLLPEGFAVPMDDGGLEQVRGMGASEDGAPGSPNLQDHAVILWDESQSRPRSSGGGSGSGSSSQMSSSVNGQSY